MKPHLAVVAALPLMAALEVGVCAIINRDAAILDHIAPKLAFQDGEVPDMD